MNKNDQEFLVQKIRTQYMEKESSELDALRELDKRVKRPANIFAYTFGSFSAVVMGAGMSLVMTDIGDVVGITNPMIPGIIIGVIGMAMVISNYPIFRRILNNRRKRYAEQIIVLSDNLIKNESDENLVD